MKGIELSKKFFEEYGKLMIHNSFSEIEDKIAVGLFGSGSECFGYDDDISRDHDFEPGFCIYIPNENVIDRRTAFLLERAYAKLPKEFMGIKRNLIAPVGGHRHGVFRTDEFFKEKIGSDDGFLSIEQWITTPEHYLAEITNGEVFIDNLGELTEIRNRLSFYPKDIQLKKLAGNILLMAQSGQYNYKRCISHGEPGAAQLSAIKFSDAAMKAVFLLNKRYMPFYKWSFRAMRELTVLSQLSDTLEYLISSDNDDFETKQSIMEDTAVMIIDELKKQELTDAICTDLEKHAYSVNDRISDPYIRSMNIFAAI